mmetsp:Transcript_58097/g.131633  ORF Transcript_58097/g.131633 Transcript_58097/m.131633 type:complete len:256 (-) Transcript_58097:70-837(-)
MARESEEKSAGAKTGGGKKRTAEKSDAPVKTNPKKKKTDKTDKKTEEKIEVEAAAEVPKENTSLVLHLSQLAFDSTKPKVVAHFENHGCTVNSTNGIRFVFDSKGDFTGVAFLEVVNEKSSKNALKLHRSSFGGRRINVRPYKSKEELASIAEARNESLKAKGVEYRAAAAMKEKKGGADGVSKTTEKTKSGKWQEKKEKVRKPDLTQAEISSLATREKWSKSKKARERAKRAKAAKRAPGEVDVKSPASSSSAQ